MYKTHHKNKIYPINHGYNKRINSLSKYGIVIHTTNGRIGSAFLNEFNYLVNSKLVSAHYIISKDGSIWEILDLSLCAWHAGLVNDKQYNNNNSIGIEMHYTPGEIETKEQIDALTDLCRDLIFHHSIAGVKMHREIAIDKHGKLGRKKDPSNMTNEEFTAWKRSLHPSLQA